MKGMKTPSFNGQEQLAAFEQALQDLGCEAQLAAARDLIVLGVDAKTLVMMMRGNFPDDVIAALYEEARYKWAQCEPVIR